MWKLILALLLMTTPAFAITNQWRGGVGTQEIDGTTNAALIGFNSYNHIVQPLDNLLFNYCNEYLIYGSGSSIKVSSGSCAVSNSQGTIRLFMQDTATSTLTSSNLDTGSLTASTTYYVYSTAATNAATSSTYYISASSTAPSGSTYYYQIGSFYYNASSAIENVKTNGYYPTSSPTSNGTFSANIVYQNNTANKIEVVGDFSCTSGGGWGGMNVRGDIGETSSPGTEVSAAYYSLSGSGTCAGTVNFIVPSGWYWEVIQNGSGVTNGLSGSLNRLETWNLN